MHHKCVRVLLLVESLHVGGLERIVEMLARRMNPVKYHISIWCLAEGGLIADALLGKGYDLRLLNLNSYYRIEKIFQLSSLIRKHDFHILHTHGYFASTFGRLAALWAGTPVVLSHVHTTGQNLSRRNIWLDRILSRFTDRVICCSKAVRDFVVSSEGIAFEKTVMIYNGVCCSQRGKRRIHTAANESLNINITASLTENKGHRFLIEACAQLIRKQYAISISIIGQGPLLEDLKRLSRLLCVEESVQFFGLLPDVSNVIANADICVLCSIEREGLGLSLIEAMCHGKPIVGTRVGGIMEVIKDGVNGYLVPPMNADSLAIRLEELINDESKREQMGKAGRLRFEERFCTDKMVQQVEGLYDRIIEEKYLGKKGILYIHNANNIGGGEQSLLNLWQNLRAEDHYLHLMTSHPGPFADAALKAGVTVHYVPVPRLKPANVGRVLKTLMRILTLCRRKRIRIIHSYAPRNNILAAMVGRMMDIPVIWHERNLIFGNEADISRKLWFLPDRIICNSKAVSERFRLASRIPKRVQVVLNGVDTRQFTPGISSESLKSEYNFDGKKIIGLVSNLGRRKNPEFLIDAAPEVLKQVTKVTFVIIGGEFAEEDTGRKAFLQNKASTLGIADYVRMTGFLEDPSDLIRGFDIGVAVTEKEACSRAILELMATGKPVIAFDTGGNPELVEHGVTGFLVPTGNIPAFVEKVVFLLENDSLRQKMGRAARKRVERLFDVKVNAQKTNEIYMKLLSKRKNVGAYWG